MVFRKIVLEPGQVLRVGRDEATDFPLPHDSLLGGMHFELAWNGSECRIRDLKTITGTLVGGKPIKEGFVPHGGWIRAGQTDFSMYFERNTPPREPEHPSPPALAARHARVLDLLRSQQSPLYAILDAARSERILELLHESVEECQSLYEGPHGAALTDVAPFLVSLHRTDSWLLENLIQEGWDANWGIYLTSPEPLLKVRRHFRKFLMVEAEGVESRLYFRFYDPRVLGPFLLTCPPSSRNEFFGEVENFIFGTPSGAVVEKLSLISETQVGQHASPGARE
jgi:hypothetical protein